MSATQRILLFEPAPGAQVSGGYLYNRSIAEHAAVLRTTVSNGELEKTLDGCRASSEHVVLLDSLFLQETAFSAFVKLRERTSARLGVMLHALPSFIRVSRDRDAIARSQPLAPTRDELRMLGVLDLVVAPGQHLLRLLEGELPRLRTVHAPPGIALPAVAGVARSQTEPAGVSVLSIGALTPNKGWSDGARALASLSDVNWSWDVVGSTDVDPRFFDEWRAELKQLGIEPRVRVWGQLPPARVFERLELADVVLHASYTENYPLVLMEATAAGVPVVAYAAGGVADIVVHGSSGRLAPTLDVDGLALQLREVLASAALRAQLSAGARQVAQQWQSWPAAAEHLVTQLLNTIAPH